MYSILTSGIRVIATALWMKWLCYASQITLKGNPPQNKPSTKWTLQAEQVGKLCQWSLICISLLFDISDRDPAEACYVTQVGKSVCQTVSMQVHLATCFGQLNTPIVPSLMMNPPQQAFLTDNKPRVMRNYGKQSQQISGHSWKARNLLIETISSNHTLDITYTDALLCSWRHPWSQRATVWPPRQAIVIRLLVTTLSALVDWDKRGIIGKLYVYIFWITCICFGVEFPFKVLLLYLLVMRILTRAGGISERRKNLPVNMSLHLALYRVFKIKIQIHSVHYVFLKGITQYQAVKKWRSEF